MSTFIKGGAGFPKKILVGMDVPPITPIANAKSIGFDGTDEYLSRVDTTPLSITGDITIAAWIKKTSGAFAGISMSKTEGITNASWIISLDASDPYEVSITFTSDGDGLGSATTTAFTVGRELAVGTWYHLVVAIDVSVPDIAIYVDGVDTSNAMGATDATAIHDGNAHNLIGAGDFGVIVNAWVGNIDEPSIWDTLLDASNVAAIYNERNPIDLNTNAGDYTKAGDLQSWLRNGDDASDTSSTIIEQATASSGSDWTANNLEAEDIESEVP